MNRLTGIEPTGLCTWTDIALTHGFCQVTLTATPDAGSKFVGWSGGGCSGTGECTVTVDGRVDVQA